MSQVQFVNDGDFTIATQNGVWRKERPFSKWGYFQPFIARRKMRQLESSFAPPTPMQTRTFANEVTVNYPTAQVSSGQVLVTGTTTRTTPATAYLTGISEAAPVDDASGLVEWEEEWSNIPEKMLVWGSMTYSQVYGTVAVTNEIQEINTTFDSYTIYEFSPQPEVGLDIFAFVTTAGTSFPLPVPTLITLIAPKLVEFNGELKVLGGPSVTAAQIIAQSVPILAEDSSNSIYQGRIIQRESRWVIKKLFTAV